MTSELVKVGLYWVPWGQLGLTNLNMCFLLNYFAFFKGRVAIPSPVLKPAVFMIFRRPHCFIVAFCSLPHFENYILIHSGRSQKRCLMILFRPSIVNKLIAVVLVYYRAKWTQWLDSAYLEKCKNIVPTSGAPT